MRSTRKRRKTNTSLESSAISSPTNPPDREDTSGVDGHEASTSEPVTPSTTQATHKTDEEELQRARQIYANGGSSSYKSYLTPELSTQLDKHRRRMIAYPCRINLKKHADGCTKKQNDSNDTKTLASLGIKGTGEIDAREVAQLCAVWCAEAARPFSALVDESHQAILHPTIRKHLPSRRDVSRDIHMLYSAIQENYKGVLKSHTGALYLGVDAWQSPNGFDILGVVIYRLADISSGQSTLEAMPLDFVRLSQHHTGEYLAETVRLIVEKFGIQQKICGIVSDNASNNEVMVKELKKQKWDRFKGEGQWVRCFAHVLNLIAQAILRPFGTPKKKKASNNDPTSAQDDSSGSESDTEDAMEQIRPFNRKTDIVSGDEDSSSSDLDSNDADEPEDSDVLDQEDIEQAIPEGESDRYTTKGCKESLAKFRVIAKKLRFSPNSKTEFIEICRDKGCPTPHTVERDVRTRWNSTYTQLSSIIRCKDAILEWQRHKRHGVLRRYYLDQTDFDLANDLAEVLNLFYEITLQVLISGSPRLANTVVFIDQITEHLSSAISGSTYPPALKNACRLGLKITNKYYSLTDTSPLYRIAIISQLGTRVDHRSHTPRREMWVSFYKPQPVEPTPSAPSSINRPKTSMLAGLGTAAAARGGILSSDPLDIWLAGGLILDGDEPVNPLKWWSQQKRTGNTHGGLVHMALDVLSCPATSVDVERAFSFGCDYVSSKRHRLSSESISRGMSVAFYSKNGLIKEGVLDRWKTGIQTGKKLNAKPKGKKKVIVLDDE
ncbi:hypothetical protein PSTT_08150 [Puccinia striiformis]|uniref:HAT C-terminal dimerisation domain-containing protein n=1 Tax=Puccinia striiformis TaxID=27350 RepID=A0A2S4VDH3_9BASI|nr:hypothetical protein PSTT_08150 [Puccinia striiformis]